MSTTVRSVMVSYDFENNAYNLYHSVINKTFISFNVPFDEILYPMTNINITRNTYHRTVTILSGLSSMS